MSFRILADDGWRALNMETAAFALGLLAFIGCLLMTRLLINRRQRQRKLKAVVSIAQSAKIPPRVVAMQAELAPMRDPELMEVVTNFGFILDRAEKVPKSKRTTDIDALVRQAEAATRAFTALPYSPSVRADYMTRLCDLAESLATNTQPNT